MGERLRLMAVHAHPDDESSKGAATMARYLDEGVEVLVVTCTGGERGSILNPRLQHDPNVLAHLSAIRRQEMDTAREILGVRQAWLGFVDSGLPEGDPLPPLPEGCFALQPVEVAAAPLVRLVREFRPHVLTTYDENGGYPHPDHIMCHRVAVAAFEAAGDPTRYPGQGEPWEPLKLYYNQTFSKARTVALHEALLQAGLPSPYAEWLERWSDREERRITTRVPCADYFSVRDRALLAHATQVDPDGSWFACPLEIQRRVWPTEDFELARSRVSTDLPEDDLFAGIREPAQSSAGAIRVAGAVLPFAVDPDKVSPGTLGFLVVLALGVATWLLLRSMTGRIKRVDFEERDPDDRADDRLGGRTGERSGDRADDRDGPGGPASGEA